MHSQKHTEVARPTGHEPKGKGRRGVGRDAETWYSNQPPKLKGEKTVDELQGYPAIFEPIWRLEVNPREGSAERK